MSYSSGTFYEANCQRSVYAYPYLLHNAHPTWTFVKATCAGAKTGDILNTQVNSVTSDTNWVTYTIGGNDAGFSSVITECALPGWASNCDGAINTAQAYITNTLPGRLDLVNNAIKSRRRARKWWCSTTRGGSSTEWINGLSNPTGESYHPKVTGHASGYYPVVKGVTG